MHFSLSSVGIHCRGFNQKVGRLGLNPEMTSAVCSGPDRETGDAMTMERITGDLKRHGQEGPTGRGEAGTEGCHFMPEWIGFADVMEEDSKGKGGA